MHSFYIVYEDILITDQTRDLWGSLSRHVHFHHTTSCYFTIDCVHKRVRGTREYFAMDYPLQLEKFTSTQLADIIVEAACILKARSAPQANDSSPTNKIPQGDPCRQEAGQGCFQTNQNHSGERHQAQGESGTQGSVAPEGNSAAEGNPAAAKPAPGESPTPGANPGVGSQQPGVSPRGPQPYSFTGIRGRFPEGRPKEPQQTRKAPPGPPPPQLSPERRNELIRLVRKLFVIEISGMNFGWVFALDLKKDFQMEDIVKNAKALIFVLHPDRSNMLFGNMSPEERGKCQAATRQAYDFIDGHSMVASMWLNSDPPTDRAFLFHQRPLFDQFDDSFLPEFFRRDRPPAKAPPPGSFENFQRGHQQFTPTPRGFPPAKSPSSWAN